jgi:hypothetical protein
MMDLTGLQDDYVHDGRVISEILLGYAKPLALKKSSGNFQSLAAMYKQINAPFGQFAMDTLTLSTKGLASTDANDATYSQIESQIQSLTQQRNALAQQMVGLLDGAEFKGQAINNGQAAQLIQAGQSLLDQMHALATAP